MRTDDATYNAFALGLVDHISRRALGRDEAGARVVGRRPADHVLAGFLTPQRTPEEFARGAENVDDGPDATDLPKDTAYEQSALGMEWLIDLDAARGQSVIVQVALSVYVRRIPPFADQEREAHWSVPRKEGQV